MKTKIKEEAKAPLEDDNKGLGTDVSVKLKGLIGVAKLPNDFDEKKVLTEYFENKHLRDRH